MKSQASRVFHDPEAFARAFFLVRTKDQRVVPYVPMDVQRKYTAGRTGKPTGRREICVKARQVGITTCNLAWALHSTLTRPGTVTCVIGHDEAVMQGLLDATRTMLTGIPESIKPAVKYDNKGELYFRGLDSRFWVGTFRMTRARGRTINNLILTEVAFWEDSRLESRLAGFTEAVPITGNITIESTPHGIGNWFWREVEKARGGDSAYALQELPWWMHAEYAIEKQEWGRLPEKIRPGEKAWNKAEAELAGKGVTPEQLAWRRWKIWDLGDGRTGNDGVTRSRLFAQEYECDFLHSGTTVFDPATIIPSCHWQVPTPGARYVHGCDTAEGVEDGNFDVMETLCVDTGEFVAQIRGRWSIPEFAERIHYQAMKYPGLVGVERNNTGHAVLLRLAQLWEETRTAVGTENMPYRIYGEEGKAGFLTNELTRTMGIVDFDEALKQPAVRLAHEDTVGNGELRAWTYNARQKQVAPSGGHDDTILAKIIAWQMRKWVSRRGDAPKRTGRATRI